MEKEESLKDKMSFEEISEVFVANNPWFVPNYSNVGRFAKKLGYVRMKQMTNKHINYFYVKSHNNEKK